MRSRLFLIIFFFVSNGFSQQLVSYKLLPCHNYAEDIYRERISSQKLSNDTLYLEIDLIHNCSAQLEPEMHTNGDSLFINLKNVSDVYATCICCYSMLLTITEMENSTYNLIIDSTQFLFSSSKYIDVPPRNIPKKELKNQISKNGLRIGYWKNKSKIQPGSYYISYYGAEPDSINHPLWIKSFNKKNELISVSVEIIKPTDRYMIYIDLKKYEEILLEKQITLHE